MKKGNCSQSAGKLANVGKARENKQLLPLAGEQAIGGNQRHTNKKEQRPPASRTNRERNLSSLLYMKLNQSLAKF